MKFITAILFLALLASVGCRQKGTTDAKFRQYFQLEDFGSITPESVRVALIKKFPVGTSAKEISTVIEKNGLIQREFNQYSSLDKGHIFCRIYRGSKDFVDDELGINFVFDVDDKLQDVIVKRFLTGL